MLRPPLSTASSSLDPCFSNSTTSAALPSSAVLVEDSYASREMVSSVGMAAVGRAACSEEGMVLRPAGSRRAECVEVERACWVPFPELNMMMVFSKVGIGNESSAG